MKLNITCPKCGSDKISVAGSSDGIAPMYRCDRCGYKKRIFPKFETDKDSLED